MRSLSNSSTKTGFVTLSRNLSTAKVHNTHGNKSFHDLSRSTTYTDPSKAYKTEAYHDPPVSTVHVTLERIQEVI